MQMFIDFLQQNFWFFIVLVTLLSMCVGSFLNVVIYRLPLIMYREMIIESQELLNVNNQEPYEEITLSKPQSRCPNCHTSIKYRDNIPVIGWLLLKGKCRTCHYAISAKYPLIECLTGMLSMIIAVKYGVSYQALALLVLTYALIALTFIDFKHQLLPDRIVYPLTVLGLCVNTVGLFVTPNMAIWGLTFGFGVLWTILYVFKIITGKDGMGYGDLKLLACLGAWFGYFIIPNVLLIASIFGVIVGIWLRRKHGESAPYAFGPYLAIGGWLMGVLSH